MVGLWPTNKTEERLLFRPLINLIALSTDPKYNSSKYVAFSIEKLKLCAHKSKVSLVLTALLQKTASTECFLS